MSHIYGKNSDNNDDNNDDNSEISIGMYCQNKNSKIKHQVGLLLETDTHKDENKNSNYAPPTVNVSTYNFCFYFCFRSWLNLCIFATDFCCLF